MNKFQAASPESSRRPTSGRTHLQVCHSGLKHLAFGRLHRWARALRPSRPRVSFRADRFTAVILRLILSLPFVAGFRQFHRATFQVDDDHSESQEVRLIRIWLRVFGDNAPRARDCLFSGFANWLSHREGPLFIVNNLLSYSLFCAIALAGGLYARARRSHPATGSA